MDCGPLFNAICVTFNILRTKIDCVPQKMEDDEYDLMFRICLALSSTTFLEFAFAPTPDTTPEEKKENAESLFNYFDDIFAVCSFFFVP